MAQKLKKLPREFLRWIVIILFCLMLLMTALSKLPIGNRLSWAATIFMAISAVLFMPTAVRRLISDQYIYFRFKFSLTSITFTYFKRIYGALRKSNRDIVNIYMLRAICPESSLKQIIDVTQVSEVPLIRCSFECLNIADFALLTKQDYLCLVEMANNFYRVVTYGDLDTWFWTDGGLDYLLENKKLDKKIKAKDSNGGIHRLFILPNYTENDMSTLEELAKELRSLLNRTNMSGEFNKLKGLCTRDFRRKYEQQGTISKILFSLISAKVHDDLEVTYGIRKQDLLLDQQLSDLQLNKYIGSNFVVFGSALIDDRLLAYAGKRVNDDEIISFYRFQGTLQPSIINKFISTFDALSTNKLESLDAYRRTKNVVDPIALTVAKCIEGWK